MNKKQLTASKSRAAKNTAKKVAKVHTFKKGAKVSKSSQKKALLSGFSNGQPIKYKANGGGQTISSLD